MRVLLALALAAFAGCAHVPARAPASETACNERISDEVRDGRAAVPRYIFHFGKKSILDADVRDRGIPEDVWWNVIFGKDDRWKLPRYRRGLYGTDRAFRADAFANRQEPAVIRVEIREECRNPKSVATTLGLTRDPRFVLWKRSHPEWDAGACADASGKLATRLYAKFDKGEPEERIVRCEGLVDAFLVDAKIRVVQDEAVEASWYLRDPKCIATIEGTDRELFAMMADPDFFSPDRCGENPESLSTARIFMGAALRDRPDPENALFRSAVSNWSRAKLEEPPSPAWIRDFAEAYGRCFRARRLPELEAASRSFDGVLSGIEKYDYWVHLNEEPTNDFASVCR